MLSTPRIRVDVTSLHSSSTDLLRSSVSTVSNNHTDRSSGVRSPADFMRSPPMISSSSFSSITRRTASLGIGIPRQIFVGAASSGILSIFMLMRARPVHEISFYHDSFPVIRHSLTPDTSDIIQWHATLLIHLGSERNEMSNLPGHLKYLIRPAVV